MKKLVIAATLFAALSNQKAQAQDYYHGIGAQLLVSHYSVKGNLFGVDVSQSNTEFVPSIMYKATLGFELSNDKYFAVSAYPSLGFNYRSNDMGQIVIILVINYQFSVNSILVRLTIKISTLV